MIEQIREKVIRELGEIRPLLERDNVPLDNDLWKEISANVAGYDPASYAERIGAGIAKYFDHTVLKPDCNGDKVVTLCEEALANDFYAVCIPPIYVGFAKTRFPKLTVATVIGFPLGYNATKVKEAETRDAVLLGADEIDMVQNFTFLREGKYFYVYNEELLVKKACSGKLLKVIHETSYLTFREKVISAVLSYLAGADYIKTSTGFSDKGAMLEDIILMKMVFGKRGVKASGGIRTYDFVRELVLHGVDRIGASASVTILDEWKKNR